MITLVVLKGLPIENHFFKSGQNFLRGNTYFRAGKETFKKFEEFANASV